MHRCLVLRAPTSLLRSPTARCRPLFVSRGFHAGTTTSTKRAWSFPVNAVAVGVALTAASLYSIQRLEESDLLRHRLRGEIEASIPKSVQPMWNPAETKAELLDDDNRAAFKSRSTMELIRALFVYKLCGMQWIVDLAPHVVNFAEKIHLEMPVYWFVKRTFFAQFCGGETPEECTTSMDRLAYSGINCILDLSVEADLHIDEVAPVLLDDLREPLGKYWRHEKNADVIVEMTKSCLRTASEGYTFYNAGPCAAIKVTAFAPPELLLRINHVLYRMDQIFHDHQVDGQVGSQALQDVVDHVLPPAQTDLQSEQREALVARLRDQRGTLDYIEYHKLFNLQGPARDVWWATRENRESCALLTEDEMQAYDRMIARLDDVCSFAHQHKVGVMVDAEQSYFQEAIDHVALNLQAKYNSREDEDNGPTVFNTYQMYTKAAQRKLEQDVERSSRENFTFAAKLVRGAYMVSERKRAAKMNYPSPIHDTLQDTHESFNGGIKFLLHRLGEHQEKNDQPLTIKTAPIVFMVASHNRDSVVLTVDEMDRHHVHPRSGVVHFGQLYGMQDPISYTLGKNGYSIYKYLPYGKINEVIPYLLRRAQENSAVLASAGNERRLMLNEVKERIYGQATSNVPSSASSVPSSIPEDVNTMNTATETA